jgi:hypothetical protein
MSRLMLNMATHEHEPESELLSLKQQRGNQVAVFAAKQESELPLCQQREKECRWRMEGMVAHATR